MTVSPFMGTNRTSAPGGPRSLKGRSDAGMGGLLIGLALGLAVHAQADDLKTTLTRYAQVYEQELAASEAVNAAAHKTWADGYLRCLTTLEQTFQQAGDLDSVLIVREEETRFAASPLLPPEAMVKAPKGLADLQTSVLKSMQAVEMKKTDQILNAATRYLAALEGLKKNLTRQGSVDDAVEVNAEISRVKQRAEITAAQFALAAAGAVADAPEPAAANPVPSDVVPLGARQLPPKLRHGLVLHYSFDRSEGTKVSDKSGKSHTGLVHGAKWIPKGKVGGAYEFNGRGDYIDTKSNFSGMDEITVCGWSFFTKTPADSSIITQYGGSTSENVWALFSAANGKGAEVNFCPANGIDYNFYGNAYDMRQWKHLCVTYARGIAVTLYENGVPVNSVPVPDLPLRTTGTSTAKVAASQGADGYWGSGVIDEVMIFDRALSAEEVKQIYDAQK